MVSTPRVLVCGGRRYGEELDLAGRPRPHWRAERSALVAALERLHPSVIITGRCVTRDGQPQGADRIAGEHAHEHGIDLVEYPALWTAHGRGAGQRRNAFMLEDSRPDVVVAATGGQGTENTKRLARAAGVHLLEVGLDKHPTECPTCKALRSTVNEARGCCAQTTIPAVCEAGIRKV